MKSAAVLAPPAREAPPLRRLCLVGGGTGGHLAPGLALAERAAERFPGLEVALFRTRRAVESRLLEGCAAPVEVHELDLPAPGRSPWSLARFAWRSGRAAREVRAFLRRTRPEALVALGGYPSLPGVLAARREGVPAILLEQNRVPGRAVRRLARWVSAVACPDPDSAALLARRAGRGSRVAATGNPLRRAVLLAREARRERRAAEDLRGEPRPGARTVVVVGGSQGARGLNRAVEAALPFLERERSISWVHLCGPAGRETLEEAYRRAGLEATVLPFSAELPALLARADLCLARAGGSTVAELAAIGVPAILVPYPHHRDRHQLHNAEGLARAGAALVWEERELDGEALAAEVLGLLRDRRRLRSMEEAALGRGRPDAADRVLDLILGIVRGGSA